MCYSTITSGAAFRSGEQLLYQLSLQVLHISQVRNELNLWLPALHGYDDPYTVRHHQTTMPIGSRHMNFIKIQ
jgi:hypothetical protein